jgi:hypothetical protein
MPSAVDPPLWKEGTAMAGMEMAWGDGAARRRSPKRRLALLAASTLLSLLVAELLFRHYYTSFLYAHRPGDPSIFRHDGDFGWWGRENMRETAPRWWETKNAAETGPRAVLETFNNADGFRDIEHDPASPARRVLFIGDSYTWGSDVTQGARFTELLRARFPDLDIYNMGLAGFGTDQELLVLRRYGQRTRPSLVVVEVCHWNDREDNASSYARYTARAKPYFELDGVELVLRGVPVPELPRLMESDLTPLTRYSYLARYVDRVRAIRPARLGRPSNPRDITPDLLLAMRAEADKLGAQFLVAFTADMPEIASVLEARGCPFVSLQSVTMRGGSWNPETTFPMGFWHWNEEGHRRVAGILAARMHALLSQ